MKQTVYTILLTMAFVMGVAAQKGVTRQPIETVKPKLQNLLKSRILKSANPNARNASGAGEDQIIFDFAGVQNSMATYDSMNDLYRENSFVLNGGFDSLSTHLNVYFDYSIDPMDPNHSIISGGKWSMIVYYSGMYIGVIYGEIASGDITVPVAQIPTFKPSGETTSSTRQIDAQFRITGGMDEYADLSPDGVDRPFSSTTSAEGVNAPAVATLAF